MTKQITIQMTETDALDSFTVSEQFIELWQKCAGSIDPQLNEESDNEFEKLIDSVYITLTHLQRKQLFTEALELHNNSLNKDTGYCYEISARMHLHMCIGFSIMSYCTELTA